VNENTIDDKVARYCRLPYARDVSRISDEAGTYFVVSFPDLPGLFADGESESDAMLHADVAFVEYIAAHLEAGNEVLQPAGAERIIQALDRPAVSEVLLIGPRTQDDVAAASVHSMVPQVPEVGSLVTAAVGASPRHRDSTGGKVLSLATA